MPEFAERDGFDAILGDGWSLQLDAPGQGCMRLELGKELALESGTASFNNLLESSALPGKRRLHASIDGAELSAETRSVIPFGAEPSVGRRIRALGNHVCCQCDLEMRASFPMERIFAGALSVSGDIARVAALPFPASGVHVAPPKWMDFESVPPDGAVHDSPEPPLSFLVESKEGRVLELSSGDDLWRWANAARLGAESRFAIKRTAQGLELHREIFRLKEDMEPPQGRNWRLSWLMAWLQPEPSQKAARKKASKAGRRLVLDMKTFDWPESARCFRDGVVSDAPCVCSPAALNCLKRWLRGNLARAGEDDVFALTNVEPHFCMSASHFDRPKLGVLPHWDMPALLEFKRWACRQLSGLGASLVLELSKDAASLGLPSLE